MIDFLEFNVEHFTDTGQSVVTLPLMLNAKLGSYNFLFFKVLGMTRLRIRFTAEEDGLPIWYPFSHKGIAVRASKIENT